VPLYEIIASVPWHNRCESLQTPVRAAGFGLPGETEREREA